MVVITEDHCDEEVYSDYIRESSPLNPSIRAVGAGLWPS